MVSYEVTSMDVSFPLPPKLKILYDTLFVIIFSVE